MRKILTTLLLICLFVPAALADMPPHRVAPRYVPGDSIILWDAPGFLPLRNETTTDDPQPRTAILTPPTKREQRRLLRHWNTGLQPRWNVLGTTDGGSAATDSQDAADILHTAMGMYLADGDAKWMDVVERTIHNGLYRAALYPSSADDAAAARQALADATSAIYATDDEGVYVNLFVNNTAHVVTHHYNIYVDQLTPMPDEGRVKIRLSGWKGSRLLTLRIRIPAWVDGSGTSIPSVAYQMADTLLPDVYVNGRQEDLPVESGYWVVRRQWNSGDEVFFDLPMTPRILRRTDNAGRPVRGAVAVSRGPVVYSCVSDTSGCYFSANAPLTLSEDSRWFGIPVWTGHLFRDAGTPADAPAPEAPLVLVPWREATLFRNPLRPTDNSSTVVTTAVEPVVWLREPR